MFDVREILTNMQEMSPPEQEAYLQKKLREANDEAWAEIQRREEQVPRQKTYVVTQERELKLPAASPADAVRLASVLLVPDPTIEVEAKQSIKEVSITAREDY